jgi:EVE domain
MPGSHWLITLSPENYEITRGTRFNLLGLRNRHRKKAERVAVGDRVLYYVLEERIFPATATVTSAYFEDRHPVWINRERKDDPFPYRVHTQPNLVLEPGEGLDAEALAPRLLYLKRWPPEQWYLALQGDVHLLSSQDFQLVEREMQRVFESRRSRRERPPRRPEPEAATDQALSAPAQAS